MSEVDMSLDDIIKQNRGSKKNHKGQVNKQRLKNLGTRSGLDRHNVSPKKEGLARLHISNLHYNVSNRDVSQLFSEIGQIKKAAVHYDKSGRSLGTAEVTFLTRDAAIRAIKKYNQVPLDGRPMNIILVPNPGTVGVRSPAKSRIAVKPGSGIKKSQPNKGGRRMPNRGQGGNNNKSKRQPKNLTAEDLDKELDDYTMKLD